LARIYQCQEIDPIAQSANEAADTARDTATVVLLGPTGVDRYADD
jgi:hypothetical protein